MAGDTKTKPPRISKGGEWAFGGTEIDSIGLVSLGHKREKEIARERERERYGLSALHSPPFENNHAADKK